MRRTTRSPRAGLVAIALITALVGCGEDGAEDQHGGGALSDTEHNEADVVFASEMLQHHAQALSMVDLTLERPLEPEVQDLAEQIRAAQAPEIETFTDWLTEWDEEIPETMRDHANAGHGDGHGDGHGAGGMAESMEGMETDMPGMMSADEMSALQAAPDAEFEDRWLELMIEHHTGAIEMAEQQQEQGRYRPAVELAQAIATSQATEVAAMEELLGS